MHFVRLFLKKQVCNHFVHYYFIYCEHFFKVVVLVDVLNQGFLIRRWEHSAYILPLAQNAVTACWICIYRIFLPEKAESYY